MLTIIFEQLPIVSSAFKQLQKTTYTLIDLIDVIMENISKQKRLKVEGFFTAFSGLKKPMFSHHAYHADST